MSQNLHELCCSLVEEFYGEFHAQLFSHLAYHGRLSAPQLAQRSHLPLKQVKAGLAMLVQSRLVHHHTTAQGSSTYQANTNSTYDLIRIGRLNELVHTHLGELSATVVSETFLLGFATIAEVEKRTLYTLSVKPQNMTNGDHNSNKAESGTIESVRSSIQTLLEHGYMTHVRSAHLQSSFDARQDVEDLFGNNKGVQTTSKGKKGQAEVEEKIDNELRRRITTQTPEYGFTPDATPNQKRSWDESDNLPGSKRQKVNGDGSIATNGYTGSSLTKPHVAHAELICVTFNKLVSKVRNNHLAGKAQKFLGRVYSNTLQAALSQVPGTEQWSPEEDDNWLDLSQVRNELNQDRSNSMANGTCQNGLTEVNGTYAHGEEFEGQKTSYNEVDRTLALLASSEFNFLHGAYGKEWKISKTELDRFIRQHEIQRMMGGRLGPPALRIIRMLIDKGKLDEKTLQEVGLLSAKDLRQTLAELKHVGFVDLQEVPREAQRQPNRTIYLWFHDSDRVQKVLLDGLYKAMTRLMQRLKLERSKLSSTLEKVERSDVQGNEEHIMSAAELRVLKRWHRMEQWLLGEMGRLDESVALLRDL